MRTADQADHLAARCTRYGYAFAVDLNFCHAAATDRANAQMRRAGRKAWNDDDWNLACEAEDKFVQNAGGCFAEGKFMWPINDRLHGNALKAAIKAQAMPEAA